MKILQRWLTIALLELLAAGVALAIAPIFLNSNHPEVGFALWLAVPLVLGGSAAWAGVRVAQARRSRALWLRATDDPASQALSWVDFLAIPPEQVETAIANLQAGAEELAQLQIAPIDLLRQPARPDRRH